jgi:penicillin-binding protein 1A
MTSVFSVFPSGGLYNEPYFIDRIEDAEGNIMEEHEAQTERVMSEESAYLISNILRSVVREGTATAVRSVGAPAGGKTGTTNDFLDAWFIGFTPGVACGVWIGKDREEPLGKNETGSRAAAPIWLDYMKNVVKSSPQKPFIPPSNIVFMRIDKKTGALALPDNPDSTFESFRQTEIPTSYKPPRPIM